MRILAALALALVVTGCATRGGQIAMETGCPEKSTRIVESSGLKVLVDACGELHVCTYVGDPATMAGAWQCRPR